MCCQDQQFIYTNKRAEKQHSEQIQLNFKMPNINSEKGFTGINTSTRLAGLLGHPVGHSVSPYLQNFLAEKYGINMAYLGFDIAEGKLEDAVKGGLAMNAIGFNVTVPYKKDVMEYLAGIDPVAEKIGAVNTLKPEADGFHGYNTDMPGFGRALDHAGIDVRERCVVMIGAGGAANAVLCSLLEKGAKNILLLNRTVEKAEALAERFRSDYPDSRIFTAPLTGNADNTAKDSAESKPYLKSMDDISADKWIAIQCTSVGMSPKTDETPINDDSFYERLDAAFDIIFNPEETLFLKKAREHGAKVSNGLGMLMFQGIRSFEIWNSLDVSDDIADELLSGMREEVKKNTVKKAVSRSEDLVL